MMRRLILLAALPLALAACRQEAASDTAIADAEDVGGTAGEAPTPTATPAVAAPEPAPITAIPPAFHGRWGLVPADCTSTRGDAKGLMIVSTDSIRFYESVARPALLTPVGARRLEGNYSATGEGQTWTLLQRLEVSADGRTLTRTVDPGDSAPTPGGDRFIYTRCAA